MSPCDTDDVVTTKLKNELQLPKMVETNVYICYGNEKFESRKVKRITLVDSMAASKILAVVLLGFVQALFPRCCICLSQTSLLRI